MYLGAQGVDPFYYYGNILNRFNKKEVNDFAKYIHTQECLSLYIHFINEANKLSKEHKDLVYSYIYGLLNHYVLLLKHNFIVKGVIFYVCIRSDKPNVVAP